MESCDPRVASLTMLYLEAIEHGAISQYPDLRLLVWAKRGESNYSRFFNTAATAWQFCETQRDSVDLYSSLGLRHKEMLEAAIGLRKPLPRGGEQDIHGLLGLAMEFDIQKEGRTKENLFASEDEILSMLSGLPMPPTMTVRSGGGVHVYWLFAGAWIFGSALERDRAKRVSEGWHRHVTEHSQHTVDSTYSLDRVYRVAGTVNHKYEPARPVEIIALDSTRYFPQDFNRWEVKAERASTVPTLKQALNIPRNPKDLPPLPRPVSNLIALEPEFSSIWHHTAPRLIGKSQSEYDLSIANALKYAGLSAADIATAIAINRHTNDAQNKPPGYYARTLAKAGVFDEAPGSGGHGGEEAEQEGEEEEEGEARPQAHVPEVRQEHRASASANGSNGQGPEAPPDGPGQYCELLSAAVGLSIVKLTYINRGAGPDSLTLRVQLKSGAISTINRIGMIRSQVNWKSVRTTHPHDQLELPRELGKVAWESLISRILAYSVDVTVDEDEVKVAIFIELSNYLFASRPTDMSHRKPVEISMWGHSGQPFTVGDLTYFCLSSYRKWYSFNSGKFDDNQTRLALRDEHCKQCRFGGRRYWSILTSRLNKITGANHGQEEGSSGSGEEGTGYPDSGAGTVGGGDAEVTH